MQKLPESWAEGQRIEARLDMSAEVAGAGRCPECRTQMIRAYVKDTPVWCCVQHRIALPIQNAV